MKIIRKAVETTIVSFFVILVAAVFLQVISRYIFNRPPAWTEELARYCQVWIILLASSICIRKGSHLAVDYFSGSLSRKVRKGIELFISILIIFYTAVLTVYGIRLMLVGQYQVSPAIQIKMSFVYLIFPLGGALMCIEAVLRTIALLRDRSGVNFQSGGSGC